MFPFSLQNSFFTPLLVYSFFWQFPSFLTHTSRPLSRQSLISQFHVQSPLSTSRISVAVHRRLEPDALQFLQPPTTGSTVPLLSVSCPASRPPPGFQCAIFHVRLHISTPSAPPSARYWVLSSELQVVNFCFDHFELKSGVLDKLLTLKHLCFRIRFNFGVFKLAFEAKFR